MLRSITVVAVATALVALGACGDDEDKKTASSSTAGNTKRYCALTRQLDGAGTKYFAKLERPTENPTPADFEAAERGFVEAHAAKLDDLERAAPSRIRADVRTMLDGMRVRGGLLPKDAVDEAQASAAEERVVAFEKRACTA